MSSIGSPSPFFLAGKKAYQVERSLRFNRNDNAYLTRTPSSAGNRKTFTFSAWVKLGQNGVNSSTNEGNGLFLSCGSAGTAANMTYRVTNSGYVGVDYYGVGGYYSTGRLRDPSAWYHIVWVMDTTELTAANRFKVYVNNVLFYNNQIGLSQDADTPLNNNSATTIGAYSYNTSDAYRLDGYLAEVNFIDGQAYDPSYFGETDAATGQWNPKEYVGSYGTNGFYLNFSDNSGTTATTLGKDSSGNGNNFTPYNFSVSAGSGNDSVEDTPTNNWATLNPLNPNSNVTFSEGNLKVVKSSAGFIASSNFVVTSGKWYMEVKYVSGTSNHQMSVGFGNPDRSYQRLVRGGDGELTPNTGTVAVTFADPDIIMLALDIDNGKWYIGKNGSYMLSGDPVNGTGFVHSGLSSSEGFMFIAINATSSGGQTIAANFGQQGFTYTPPTDYKALNSANLPDPTILLPNKHFDTTLYTGNNSSQEISTLNFQPDWLWFKNRGGTSWHALFDSVRGRAVGLASNSDNSEYTSSASNDLVSFDDDGFTLGSNQNWGSVNGSGNSIVTWAWNGGDTDGKTYTVKVVSDGGNKYRFDDFGTSAVTLDLAEGGSYVFDLSHSSVDGHPMKFSTTANGSHGGGSTYSTGVTYILDGVEKSEADYVDLNNFNAATSRLLKITVAASAPTLYYFCHYHNLMGGQANTNSTLGSSNFEGNTQATVKVNTTAGFSIISWTARGNSSGVYDTFGHGLGVRPNVLILKTRSTTGNFNVYNSNFSSANNKILQLSNTIAEYTSSNYWGADNTTPSSTVVHVNQGNYSSGAGATFIMYAFSEVAGYSKFGSYTGNGSSDGTFVFTGFRPAWVMVKATSRTGRWRIWDVKRNTFNVMDKRVSAESSDAEHTGSTEYIDFLSNGFKAKSSESQFNGNGETIIYLAFAESPFKNARAR